MNKPFSQACENNKEPILGRIGGVFTGKGLVLEIGSYTAQHILHFAEKMPHVNWLPSDTANAFKTLQAGLHVNSLPNIKAPLTLDVTQQPWPVNAVDGVFSANTLHIMSLKSVQHFFKGVGKILKPGANLCLYGPFKYKGKYTSPSNADFDHWLKTRDPHSGIRDFEQVLALASDNSMRLMADHAMPANNQLLVFSKVKIQH